jgi:hypothetical protein
LHEALCSLSGACPNHRSIGDERRAGRHVWIWNKPIQPRAGLPGYFLWSAYFNWLVPTLAIATADQLLRSGKWQRLGTIAAVGYVSTFLTDAALYGLFPQGWQWGNLLPGLIGAITALVSCLLLDQLNKERLRRFISTFHNTMKALRRWPESS